MNMPSAERPISDLVHCGLEERHTVVWLRSALQSAITLEFATLPPYLTALWSIKQEMHPAAVSIREAVQEEMQHMGFACNMLKAIGGTPQISGRVPVYPAIGLPGGVMPDLVVDIVGLSLESLRTFMTIEQPEVDVITGERPAPVVEAGKYATIGEFYDAIAEAFAEIKPSFDPSGQVIGPRTGWAIDSLHAVRRAINTIKEQGEGSSGTPVDFDPSDFSHYYRFAEIAKGRKIVLAPGKTDQWMYGDLELPFPDVWPTAKLPKGGYDRDRMTGAVEHLLDTFDKKFTRMVDELQATWANGDQAALWRAVEAMFAMQESALALMRIPRYDGKGNYVPRWRYLLKEEL
jgi:hypothetical protein